MDEVRPSSTSWVPNVAITTPWSEPTSCIPEVLDFTQTSWVAADGMTTNVPVLYRDYFDPAYAPCYPLGADGWSWALEAGAVFSFSPAVCPVSMTMTATGFSAYEHGGARISTAYCCSSGYTLAGTYAAGEPYTVTQCRSSIAGVFSGMIRGDGGYATATNGYQIHDAWYVAWEATDTPSMTPTPPELKLPGEAQLPLILGLVFGIGALVVAGALLFIYYRRRKRRVVEVQREKGKGVVRPEVVETKPSVQLIEHSKGKGKAVVEYKDEVIVEPKQKEQHEWANTSEDEGEGSGKGKGKGKGKASHDWVVSSDEEAEGSGSGMGKGKGKEILDEDPPVAGSSRA